MPIIPCKVCRKEHYAKQSRIKIGKDLCCSRKCANLSQTGENSKFWKGDSIKVNSLHYWIKDRLHKPKSCQSCGKFKSYLDLANISGKYKREIEDWIFLCRSCHCKLDGRSKNRDSKGKFMNRNKIVWEKVNVKDIAGTINPLVSICSIGTCGDAVCGSTVDP